ILFFFFSSRRRHTRSKRDWSSDVCSSDLDIYYVYNNIRLVRCKLWPVGQVVKTPPFHGGNTGSNPVRVIFYFVKQIIIYHFMYDSKNKYLNNLERYPYMVKGNDIINTCRPSSIGRATDL